MKLRKISTLMSVFCIGVFVMSFNVMAATTSIAIRQPIDAITGQEVTEFKKGDIIEVPIDIISDTNKYLNFGARIYYDSNVFMPGIDITEGNPSGDKYYSAHENQFTTDVYDTNRANIRNNLQGRQNKGSVVTSCHLNDDLGCMTFNHAGNTLSSFTISDEYPEFYALFTVIADYDKSLNYTGVNKSETGTGLFVATANIYENSIDPSQDSSDKSDAVINACEGAFKLTVDPEKLDSGVYINKLEATINGKKATIDAAVENE